MNSLLEYLPIREESYLESFLSDLVNKYEIEIHIQNPTEIEFNFGTIFKCMECSMFAKTYKCPPTTPESLKSSKFLKKYDLVFIITKKEYYKDFMLRMKKKHGYSTKQGQGFAQLWIDRKGHHSFNRCILELNSLLKNMGFSTIGFGAGGGCRKCKKCGLKDNEPCKKPDISLSSPESYGIDVYSTLKRINFPIEIPPRNYITRVGMIFIRRKNRDFGFITNNNSINYQKFRPNTQPDIYKKILLLKEDFDSIKPVNHFLSLKERCSPKCEFYLQERCKLIKKYNSQVGKWLEDKVIITIKYKKESEVKNSFKVVDAIHRKYGYWWAIAAIDFKSQLVSNKLKKTFKSGKKGLFCVRSFFNQITQDAGEKIYFIIV